MKVVFISNRLTPHQIPICNVFNQYHQFFFVETMKDSFDEIGWSADGSKYPYVIPYTENKSEIQKIRTLILEADAVIIGSAPDSYIVHRLKIGKLTFKYAERFYKNGINAKNFLRVVAGNWLHHARFQKYPLYMLCASAYTAYDCSKFGNYKNRLFKWGYFPEVKSYKDINKLIDSKKPSSILWVARLIELKHPDASIEVAKRLKAEGYQFTLDIIGYGVLEEQLKLKIQSENLGDCVHMLGAMKPEEVRRYMEKSEIFLFTSDRNEGWGAVLNESMNSACAVVASHAIGSVPFMVQDGVNGLVYLDGDIDDLYKKTKWLIEHRDERKIIANNAYKTMITEWNAENAVQKFVQLAEKLMNGEKNPIVSETGVCSKANILKNDWYRK